MLGHSSVSITADTYGHMIDERREDVAGCMGRALFGDAELGIEAPRSQRSSSLRADGVIGPCSGVSRLERNICIASELTRACEIAGLQIAPRYAPGSGTPAPSDHPEHRAAESPRRGEASLNENEPARCGWRGGLEGSC